MVVFRSGRARVGRVRAGRTTVRVGRKRCAVGAGTALAALVRSRPGRIRLRDFGNCSRRPRDGGGLFVGGIGRDRNRGQNGWVYKVGRRAATAGAADPAGPFGNGRLRSGARVVWFYCFLRRGSCQRTLELRASAGLGGLVDLVVTGYDDQGRGSPVAGATVRLAGRRLTTDGAGRAQVKLEPGRYTARAEKAGLIRSFGERVTVR
jgi:hypothetical protein